MMKISALVEDRTRKPELESEHGLSLLLATGGGSWLFDTGQSGIAVENARRMGIDLGGIEGVILSHGHYDHTGGLSAVLEAAGPKKVYGHPGLFRPRYSLRKKGKDRRIGIPLGQAVLERAGAHFSLSREVREIAPGIFLSGEIPLAPGAAPGEPFLTVRKMLKLRPDLFVDEQFLLVETGGGLVMINGCCHSGLINSLRHIRSIRPGSRIRAIVGGFHLRSASPRELERIAADLEEYGLELIVAGHCTGEAAEGVLAEKFGARFQSLRTGVELVL
jgi:7,8-dihydropterin-6-yl-methyl-4-(beta-D-ribofuranosyl)aminobenzene 5'-phosphate synthase